ncbi:MULTISPECIES: hypothetical protein [Gammaproteobacteria]|uniref:hypothetical protein n=1 Tax=Gammaproteobacteria TaxID=1236 RepID=UPI001ADBC3B8|nr:MULTISPECIES: hypothetical protein [Gammaproteobacteria]MBO9484477.1 hypothetical protein [Salinisphaera sp. G21_0]MBO9496904.1 hypothetical protein [Thalassotalea sp. G20_0]
MINATGDTHDYKPGRVDDLWSELLLDGKAVPHFLGGVQVDGFGRMIDKNGRFLDGIYLSGPMTSGDSIERRGRLGAFQINTGELLGG